MIQEFEISNNKINYRRKKYAFISQKENQTFLFDNNDKIELILDNKDKKKSLRMKLNDNYLMPEYEFKENFIFNKSIEIKDNKIPNSL